MDEQALAEIEARADLGCDGHGRADLTLDDLPDVLFCPCVEQTAVDVRQLLAEVRRLRVDVRNAREMHRGMVRQCEERHA